MGKEEKRRNKFFVCVSVSRKQKRKVLPAAVMTSNHHDISGPGF